jgi:hypothetical protein
MVRFSALVRRKGPNPYVDVPAFVSEEFAAGATAGRVRVTGRLAGAEFNATLVPVKDGGQVLYLPGGLRAATGVEVGDTVSLDIDAIPDDHVRPPADLLAALDATPGARSGFDRLTASHRRELIRFLEDARSTRNRAQRIGQIVAQSTGEQVLPPGRRTDRPLWTCPECGRSFVTRNLNHSCETHTLDEPFAGKPAHIRDLFEQVRRTVEAFGPVTLVPYRDRVAFMVRVRFAGVRPRQRWVDVDFWLTRRAQSPRLRKVETLSPYTHVHSVRISSPADVDSQLTGWLREAYAVGRQEHLR